MKETKELTFRHQPAGTTHWHPRRSNFYFSFNIHTYEHTLDRCVLLYIWTFPFFSFSFDPVFLLFHPFPFLFLFSISPRLYPYPHFHRFSRSIPCTTHPFTPSCKKNLYPSPQNNPSSFLTPKHHVIQLNVEDYSFLPQLLFVYFLNPTSSPPTHPRPTQPHPRITTSCLIRPITPSFNRRFLYLFRRLNSQYPLRRLR